MSRAVANNKVLHLITGLSTGGAERYLRRLLEAGLSASQEHHVLSLNDEGSQGEGIRLLGVPVHTLDLNSGIPKPDSLQKFSSIVNSINPSIVQGWMYHGNLAAYWAALRMHSKPAQVWNIRWSLDTLRAEKMLTRIVVQANRFFSTGPDVTIYNSETARNQHEAYGFRSRESQTIYNGFDTSLFKPDPLVRAAVRQELGIPDGALVIGNASRFHHAKGHRVLVSAFKRCAIANPSVHLVLAGPEVSTGKQELMSWCAEIPRRRLHLLGEHSEMHKLLTALDVYCSSSLAEAFPNSVGEAMACGTPCIVTDVGDSAYLVGDSGWIVPANDVNQLAAALASAIARPRCELVQLGEHARVRIQENFQIAQNAVRYADLYTNLQQRVS